MPIKGLTERRRLPRLGKIHLGIKKKNDRGVEYPSAVDYFVCPLEVQQVYGEHPRELIIMIPVENEDVWASQYYRSYSRSRGLICRGNGETCRRLVDTATGDYAAASSKDVAWKEDLPCDGRGCPRYGRECKEVLNLQFMLPEVPGLGIYQIDTSSINSILNINSSADLIRSVYSRVARLPLTLTLEPLDVQTPDGKRKTVSVLNLRCRSTMIELIKLANRPLSEILLPSPQENEAPLDAEDLVPEAMPTPDDGYPELIAPQEQAPRGQEPRTEPPTTRVIPPGQEEGIGWKDKPNGEPAEPGAEKPTTGEVVHYPTAPGTIITGQDLLSACYRDFKMQPREVFGELNVSNILQVKNYAEAYIQIASVRMKP